MAGRIGAGRLAEIAAPDQFIRSAGRDARRLRHRRLRAPARQQSGADGDDGQHEGAVPLRLRPW